MKKTYKVKEISIAYTIDKWYFQKKKRDGESKDK